MRARPSHSYGRDDQRRWEGQVCENQNISTFTLANTGKSIIIAELIVPADNPEPAVADITRAMAHVGTFDGINLD